MESQPKYKVEEGNGHHIEGKRVKDEGGVVGYQSEPFARSPHRSGVDIGLLIVWETREVIQSWTQLRKYGFNQALGKRSFFVHEFGHAEDKASREIAVLTIVIGIQLKAIEREKYV